jgi:hypothetical protein
VPGISGAEGEEKGKRVREMLSHYDNDPAQKATFFGKYRSVKTR